MNAMMKEVHSIFRRLLPPSLLAGEQVSAAPYQLVRPDAMVLHVARQEIGHGEEHANNQGPFLVMYRRGRGGKNSKAPWCADYCSWVIEEVYRALGAAVPIERSAHAKTLYKRIGRAGAFVDVPEPADFVCWHRGKAGSRQGHIGIVETVRGDGLIQTIEGNVGLFPAKVKQLLHDTTHERLVGFARLPAIRKELES
jgi:hypothetical protein